MPIRKAPEGDVEYYLVAFDRYGHERNEADGSLLSEEIVESLAHLEKPVSDVYLMSHGWQGDVPGAIAQYDAWIGAMLSARQDLDAERRHPDFEPLIVGLHWPSLPWGDEVVPASPGLLSGEEEASASNDGGVEAYAARIVDTPAAREAIRIILEAARRGSASVPLPKRVRSAYSTLFAESGLTNKGLAGAHRARA
jgi:hypothetical protein